MDSDFQQQQYSHHFQGLPKQQMNSGNGGLTRYRSAPSSYFSSFIDSAENSSIAGEFSPSQPRPLSPETQSILARFMENVGDDGGSGSNSRPNKLYDIPENSPVVQPQFTGSVKQETEQMNYQRNQTNSNSIGTEFRVSSSVGVDFSSSQMKMKMHIGSSGKSNSNLVRHRSSPAGLFDDIIIEDGYLVNRETGTGNYGSRGSARSNNQINFSTGENRTVSGNSEGVSGSQNDGFMTGFAVGAWETDDDFNSPENQNREGRNRPPGLLAHHLSLPKASIEKLLEFQETVPCKLRAKRGFATHPRSIAERVRRTKISERMRKLQDLVPNMDKQTNTADMLDLAVDYIKELQEQVMALTDKRDKCSCTS